MLWLSFTKVSFITRGDGEFWPRGDFVLLHGDFIREVEDEEFYGPSFVGFVVVTMIKRICTFTGEIVVCLTVLLVYFACLI